MKINSIKRNKIIKSLIASSILASGFIFSTDLKVSAEMEQDFSIAGIENIGLIEEIIPPNIVRHEGYSRDNVAENVAKAHFSDSKKVIIVNREKFPDAISATNISQGRYPVLYTYAGHVTDGTMKLLQSMPLDEIYVLGGTFSVNETVVNQLEKNTEAKVTRVSGRSRYDANVSAVRENFSQMNHVVIASGEVYSDALYGVSYANTIGAPVILTKTSHLEPATIDLLKDLKVEQATIIGGTLTVTPEVEKQLKDLGIINNRIAGRNRYIGSAEVAAASYQNPENVVVASGEVFSDALVSAPLAQKLDAPILLVKSNNLENQVREYLIDSQISLENVYIQGGPLTISKNNEKQIKGHSSYLVVSNRIPFKSDTVEDEDLLEGQTKIVQKGKDGVQKVYYTVVYEDSIEIDRIEIHRDSIKPIKEVVAVGTKADMEGVRVAEEKIELLPDEVTIEDKKAVSDIRQVYEDLTSKQKKLVDNLERLEKAEAQITKLENTYILTLKVRPVEGGSVIGVGKYEAGNEVQLETTPKEGFAFKNWLVNGKSISEETEFTYTMPEEDIEITANFQSVSEPYLSFNSRTGTITGYDITGGRDVIIPSSIDGIEVKSIGRNAFESKNITSVILPENIVNIENNAFKDNLISSINLPNSIMEIGWSAFNNNLLTSVDLPDSLQVSASHSFANNNLTDLIVPDSIEEIGSFAFYSNNIKEIELSNSLKSIGDFAFSNNNLSSLEIPENVAEIGESGFKSNELVTVFLPEGLTKIGKNAFAFNNLKNIDIPENILSIESGAFKYNELVGVTLNDKLMSIGEEAFSRNLLTSITLPESLISLGESALSRNNLKEIIIGSDVFINDVLLNSNNIFRDVYYDEINGGSGTYVGSQNGTWTKK